MEHNKHEFNKKLAETLRDGVIMDILMNYKKEMTYPLVKQNIKILII